MLALFVVGVLLSGALGQLHCVDRDLTKNCADWKAQGQCHLPVSLYTN